MAIRVVVFDIGGILEVIPEGGDPTVRYPVFEETWTARLGLAPGELAERLGAFRQCQQGRRVVPAFHDAFTCRQQVTNLRRHAVPPSRMVADPWWSVAPGGLP